MNNYSSIVLEGEIITDARYSHQYDGVNYYSVLVASKRSQYKKDTVNVFFSEDLIDMYGRICKGEGIVVKGVLVQSFVKGFKNVSILAKNYELDSEVLNKYCNQNGGRIRGTVLKSYEIFSLSDTERKVKPLLIQCKSDSLDRPFTIKCSAWDSLGDFVDTHYKEGDEIEVEYKLHSKSRVSSSGLSVDCVEGIVTASYRI